MAFRNAASEDAGFQGVSSGNVGVVVWLQCCVERGRELELKLNEHLSEWIRRSSQGFWSESVSSTVDKSGCGRLGVCRTQLGEFMMRIFKMRRLEYLDVIVWFRGLRGMR